MIDKQYLISEKQLEGLKSNLWKHNEPNVIYERGRNDVLDEIKKFEEKAERFYKETGYLAPGKSVAPAMASCSYEEERQEAWKKWIKEQQ